MPSVACAAARLVSLWLLRRANSDVARVVLAFAVPAPLLDLLRANSTAQDNRWGWVKGTGADASVDAAGTGGSGTS